MVPPRVYELRTNAQWSRHSQQAGGIEGQRYRYPAATPSESTTALKVALGRIARAAAAGFGW